MLREAHSRAGPLTLRLREGAQYFRRGPLVIWGGWSVNDTTPVCKIALGIAFKIKCTQFYSNFSIASANLNLLRSTRIKGLTF